MEIIEIKIYTKREKLSIAKNHLIPKQLKRHGLNKRTLKISDSALEEMIDFYTREAGVRNLERTIASLCRKAAHELVTKAYGIISPKPVTPVKPTTAIAPQPKPEAPKEDLSKIIKAATVKHKIFGEGEIVKVDKAVTHITVKFNVGEKSFIVGGTNCAFKNGFLKI
jgi:ATP-dependent Lon protease